MAPLLTLKLGSPCLSYSRCRVLLYTERGASVSVGSSCIHSLYIVLIGVLTVVLAMASCPRSGAVLIDGVDEGAVGGSVSGSESKRICSVVSLSELSESDSEVQLSVGAIATHSFGCASAERSTHDWFFKASNMMAVLAEGTSSRSWLNLRELFSGLFFHGKAGLKFNLQCLMVGGQACSCLTRPQEGGANIVGMKVDARSLKVQTAV